MTDEVQEVRLDKWLWAARFFKTRSLAAQAIAGGRVHVNGARVKRSKLIEPGDAILVREGPFEHHLRVKALSERRGPAREAASLYEETEDSVAARRVVAEQLRLHRDVFGHESGRPTKRDRRRLAAFKRRGPGPR